VRNSEGPIRVNSSHHQAVRDVGRDLLATAWSKDGVVEAIEDPREGHFAVGVQWHPELLTGHDELSRELFRVFVARCSPRDINTAAAGN
jgi:putative glutamine amidotransferase